MSETAAGPEAHKPKVTIKVTVAFPVSKGKPYQAEDAADTTVGVVLAAAMEYFSVANDGEGRYELTHDGSPVAETATLASVAGEAAAVQFRLVKELVQG